MQLHGLDIKVEYAKGERRSGIGKDGKRWVGPPMPCSYGAIKNTRAKDGEQVDAYIGPDRNSDKVFVLDQLNGDGRYDEAKILFGFRSKDDALGAYSRAFSDGNARDRIGSVTELSPDKFCDWLSNPANTKKPLGNLRGYASGGSVMPLIKSGSKAAISSNIKELSKTHPHDQAVAAALSTARRYAKKHGGRVGYAWGGAPSWFGNGQHLPWMQSQIGQGAMGANAGTPPWMQQQPQGPSSFGNGPAPFGGSAPSGASNYGLQQLFSQFGPQSQTSLPPGLAGPAGSSTTSTPAFMPPPPMQSQIGTPAGGPMSQQAPWGAPQMPSGSLAIGSSQGAAPQFGGASSGAPQTPGPATSMPSPAPSAFGPMSTMPGQQGAAPQLGAPQIGAPQWGGSAISAAPQMGKSSMLGAPAMAQTGQGGLTTSLPGATAGAPVNAGQSQISSMPWGNRSGGLLAGMAEGGRVGYEEGGMTPREVAPLPLPRRMAMDRPEVGAGEYGLPHMPPLRKPPQMTERFPDAYERAHQDISDLVRSIGHPDPSGVADRVLMTVVDIPKGVAEVGAELTGAPSAARAGEAAAKGDWPTAATNAMFAAPFMPGKAGLLPKGLPRLSTAVPVAGMTALGAGLLADKSDAAQAKKTQGTIVSLPGLPPELNAEYTRLLKRVTNDDFENRTDKQLTLQRIKEIKDLSNSSVQQRNTAGQEEFNRAVDRAHAVRKQEEDRDYHFQDSNVGKVWTGLGPLGPTTAGAVTALGSRGATGPGKTALGKAVFNYGLPMALGTLAGGASANFPLLGALVGAPAYNPRKAGLEKGAFELPEGHPDKQKWADAAALMKEQNPVRKAASDEFYDWEKAKERALAGGIEGFVGSTLGTDAVRAPGRLVSWLRGGPKGTAITPHGPGPVGPSSGGSPVGGGGSGTMSEAIPLQGETLPPLPTSSSRLVDRMAESRTAAGRLPALESFPNLPAPKSASSAPARPTWASDPPEGIKLKKGEYWDAAMGQPRAAGRFSHVRYSAPRAAKEDTGKSSPNGKGNGPGTEDDIAGYLNGQPVVKKPEKPPGGDFQSGGFISRALDTARRFATGGAVRVGPMVGASGGRTDALPIAVPAGAYVIPANEVAALGEGNTGAGFKKLEQMFGKSAKPHPAHGKVDIKISDGEYILSPEQVAQVGHGSLEKGHAWLDSFVKKIRSDHIQTLSSLPGPAR